MMAGSSSFDLTGSCFPLDMVCYKSVYTRVMGIRHKKAPKVIGRQVISFRVTRIELAFIDNEAVRLGMSRSECARWYLRQAMSVVKKIRSRDYKRKRAGRFRERLENVLI